MKARGQRLIEVVTFSSMTMSTYKGKVAFHWTRIHVILACLTETNPTESGLRGGCGWAGRKPGAHGWPSVRHGSSQKSYGTWEYRRVPSRRYGPLSLRFRSSLSLLICYYITIPGHQTPRSSPGS